MITFSASPTPHKKARARSKRSGFVADFELGDKLSEFAAPYVAHGLLGGAMLLPASSPEELAAYVDLGKVIRIERGR